MSEKSYLERRRDQKLGIKTDTDSHSKGKQANSENQAKDEGKAAKETGPREPPKKGPKPKIKRESKKRGKENRQYVPVRKKFLRENPVCELRLPDCTGNATEIHHSAGRENKRLLKIEDFKAACHNCHAIATEKSKEAIAAGHSKTRLGKPDKS